MDDQRFDALTRALATGTSRRKVMRGVFGGLGGLVSAVTLRGDQVSAQRLPNGSACTRATQCASFKCADGVCCDATCAGQCEACDLQEAVGTCTPLTAGTQQHGNRPACTGTDVCQGSCDGVTRTHCTQYPGLDIPCAPGECLNGWGITYGCGGDGTCHPHSADCGLFVCDAAGVACLTSCTGDDDCVGDAFCDTGTGACREERALGEDCTADGQCASGICAQGVCCVEACPGGCQVCNASGSEGFCTPAGDSTSCGLDDLCCDGECIDVQIDLEHCGQCDNACRLVPTTGTCENEPICSNGTCTFTSLPDNSICGPVNDDRCCGGVCFDVQIDEQHCGFCGNTCAAPTPFCHGGACVECLADTDCAPAEFCNLTTNTCDPDRPLGQSCDRPEQCVSGICNAPSAVCCATTCPDGVGCGAPDSTCDCGSLILAGSATDDTVPILVDDLLSVYVNDVQIVFSSFSPVGPVNITANYGGSVRVVAFNGFGGVFLRRLYLHCPATGEVQTLDADGVPGGPWPEFSTFYDETFTVLL